VGLSYATAPPPRATADRRILWIGISVIILVIAAWEAVYLWGYIDSQDAIGDDPDFYVSVAQRWLDTGVYYTERQLSGPYATITQVDNLYPPHALYLFVPFVYLPRILWWLIPLGIMGYVIWRLRPVPWSWPLLALIVALPKTVSATIYGNSDLWIGAAAAAGIAWSWPGVLATFKPSLIYFALIGIRSVHWWFTAAILMVLSLPLLPLWLEYPRVLLNNTSAGFLYSLGNLPFMLLPLVAWFFSRTRSPIARIRTAAA
jgi:hypothetical protein